MRLFASVRPPDPVLDHLARALATTAVDAPVRWTAQENWHLTLAFFGEVADGARDDLVAALDPVLGTHPFEVRLRGAGVFSGRTLWIGLGGDATRMADLAGAARAAGEQVVTYRDTRQRSRPHLTVGRVIDDGSAARRACARDRSRLPGPVDHLVRALALYEGPTWTVESLLLEQSWPGQGRGGGPRYAVEHTWPLAGEQG